jgi:phenylacetate-CoA ligase
VAEGERGELVLTTLKKTARPMIRFRTGDIVSYTTEPCQCGRTALRLHGIHGRLDDMLIIKGVNVFPSDVEAIVRKDPDYTGEYSLIVNQVNHLDEVTIQAEHRAGDVDVKELKERLKKQLKATTGISAEVEIVVPGTLPRATHKAKRVIDNRPKVWG